MCRKKGEDNTESHGIDNEPESNAPAKKGGKGFERKKISEGRATKKA